MSSSGQLRNPVLEPYGSIVTQAHLEEFRLLLTYCFEHPSMESTADAIIEFLADDGEIAKVLSFMALHEISHCPGATLFREESAFTWTLSRALISDPGYRKFLRETVFESVIEPIVTNQIPVVIELDLAKTTDEGQVVCSKEIITVLVARLFDNIRQFNKSHSLIIVRLLKQLRDLLPADVWLTVFSNLFFLRNICPHLIDPRKAGFIKSSETIPMKHMRPLILISKVIQNVASGVEFDGTKESYMQVMNDFIRKYIHFSTMPQIFETLLDPKKDSIRISQFSPIKGRKVNSEKDVRKFVCNNHIALAITYQSSPILKTTPFWSRTPSHTFLSLVSKELEQTSPSEEVISVLLSTFKRNFFGLEFLTFRSSNDFAKKYDIKTYGHAMRIWRYCARLYTIQASSFPSGESSLQTSPDSLKRGNSNKSSIFLPLLPPSAIKIGNSFNKTECPSSSSSSSDEISLHEQTTGESGSQSRSISRHAGSGGILLRKTPSTSSPLSPESQGRDSSSTDDDEEDASCDEESNKGLSPPFLSGTRGTRSSSGSKLQQSIGVDYDSLSLHSCFSFRSCGSLSKLVAKNKKYQKYALFCPSLDSKDQKPFMKFITVEQIRTKQVDLQYPTFLQLVDLHRHCFGCWSLEDLNRWSVANQIEEIFSLLSSTIDPQTLFFLREKEEFKDIGVEKIGHQKKLSRLLNSAVAVTKCD